MKNICVLLNGPIISDSRVIREIKTLSTENKVDLYYIHGTTADKEIFNANVRLFSIAKSENFYTKIVKHSCFYNEYLFFVDEVLKQGIKYDYVWANDLPDLKPAVKIKKKIGSKVIYDSHEIFLETLNQFFPFKTTFFKRIAFKVLLLFMKKSGYYVEKRLLKHVDEFITVGNGLKQYFSDKYHYSDIKIVMNCPKSSSSSIAVCDIKTELGLPSNSALLIYQGCLNEGRGLKILIEAMQYVSIDVFLLVLGSGTLKNTLEEKVAELELENKVFFKDAVPSNELLSYTQGADIGINLLEDINLSKKYAVPNKLFEYIHAGKPIISSKMLENESTYTKYNLGYLVDNTAFDIAAAINKMAVADRTQFIEECKRAKLEYNWENQEKVIHSIIK